jgi:hypothetical protein
MPLCFGEEAMLMMIYGVVVHHYHCAKLIDGLGMTECLVYTDESLSIEAAAAARQQQRIVDLFFHCTLDTTMNHRTS